MRKKAQEKQLITISTHSSLHYLLEATPQSIGELVAFADSIPVGWLEAFAAMLFEGLKEVENPAVKRRMLVILGVLINRQIFEVERIPKSRRHII